MAAGRAAQFSRRGGAAARSRVQLVERSGQAEGSGRKSGFQGSAAAKSAGRKRELSQKKLERAHLLKLQVGEWFSQFDEDGNKQLDRNELGKLLAHLHPDTPVEDEALDFVIKKATQIVSPSLTIEGSPDGSIPMDSAVKTVTRYSSYLTNKHRLDTLLKRFDSSGNGKLEISELGALLRAPCHAPRRPTPRAALPSLPALARCAPLRLATPPHLVIWRASPHRLFFA